MAYVGNTPAEAYISISSQTFTTINGTGYTLSSSVTNSEDIALFLNNVRQKPSTYTATGTVLTMGTATTTVDTLYCVYLGKGIQTVTPGLASVGTAQIADLAVTNPKVADDAIGVDELSATGTASASTYLRGDNAWSSIAADTNDKVAVSADDTTPGYLNGKLVGGTNITLTEGSGGGDETLTAALTGTIATARLGTGTADSTTFLRGDQTYAAPAGGVGTADQWRLTTNFTGLAQPIASNLEQCDTAPNNSFPGSAMTESSGIFTFPSTGYWYVTFDYMNNSSDESSYVLSAIYATVNDSAYTKISQAYMGLRSVWYQSSHCSAIIDVTDTANVKVAFYAPDASANTAANNTTQGDTAENKTYMTFLKLTDT